MKDISEVLKDLSEAERNFSVAMSDLKKSISDALNFIKEEKREEFEAQQSERTRDAVEGRR